MIVFMQSDYFLYLLGILLDSPIEKWNGSLRGHGPHASDDKGSLITL